MRANIWHVRGMDVDLLVDTGMGICQLLLQIDTPAGKPLLVVATHIHLDHVGSLHEFAERAGPPQSAVAFAAMPDAATTDNLPAPPVYFSNDSGAAHGTQAVNFACNPAFQ